MILHPSYQQMRLTHDKIAFELEYPTLLQGTAPRHALLEEFKSTKNAVLFATSSFWQGVDVPGDALSVVVIDKEPLSFAGRYVPSVSGWAFSSGLALGARSG